MILLRVSGVNIWVERVERAGLVERGNVGLVCVQRFLHFPLGYSHTIRTPALRSLFAAIRPADRPAGNVSFFFALLWLGCKCYVL